MGYFVHAGVDRVGVGLQDCFPNATSLCSVEWSVNEAIRLLKARQRPAAERAIRNVIDAGSLDEAHTRMSKVQLSPLGERYPSVVQLWGEALARFEPLFALPEPVRQLVRSADRTAMEVHERLTRAIHRHGPFSDSAAALDFVEDALLRAERRLDRQWAAAMAGEAWGPMLPHRVLPARAAVSAPMLS